MVEVDWVQKENHLRVDVGGMPVELQEKGLYDFDADHNVVRVFDGRAAVLQGTHETHVLGGHEMVLNADKLKAQGFDKKMYEDDMYRWSKLRSSYIAEANVEMARTYYGGGESYYNGGPYGYAYAPYPWYGPGWYWDPWFMAYPWIPGDGLFWSPFGWGFYSPWVVGYAPLYGFGYGRGAYFHHFGPGYRPPVAAVHGFAGGNVSPGFHSVSPGFRGGFSGGMHAGGGFHGGGGRR